LGAAYPPLSQGCSANDNSRMAVGALHHTLFSLSSCLGDEGALNVISTIDWVVLELIVLQVLGLEMKAVMSQGRCFNQQTLCRGREGTTAR